MKRFIFASAMWILFVAAAAANGQSGNDTDSSSALMEALAAELPGNLVDAEWLAANLDAANLVILDTARKPEEYQAGYVQGALFADRTAYWTEVDGVPGMFPGVDTVVSWLESLGISNDSAVVIYDAGAGLWAARLAWTLAYLGHEEWAVLDGGYGIWDADGLPVEYGAAPDAEPGSFVPNVQDQLLVDGNDILANLDNPDYVVVDTRSAGEFDGSDVRGARGGHIPGALPLEWTLNNSGSSLPTLLSSSELAEFYSGEGVNADQQVVTLCQTGVRGAHTWLALTLAGYENVALYDGSWADWSADESYPVEQ